jgi:hypothetical protein
MAGGDWSDTMYFLGFGAVIVGMVFNTYALIIGGIAAVVAGIFLDIWTGD